jgi:alkanesulfonate monooxygenase SsuD/methylene tetrahydromethanopterin reductase-like flavin-dependent oxidoreductase (luciferase family)
MKLGMFTMPAAEPERRLGEVVDWNLEVIRRAEEFGYSEVWLGEHMTAKWEPLPSSLLVIARALADTKRLVLAPGVNVLYQHHPITLALTLAQLDHMARGRLMFGFGAGGTLTDWQLYGVDAGVSQEMTSEALEIILNCWQDGGPTDYAGKYWTVHRPDPARVYNQTRTHGWHIRPYAPPHDRIALAGFSLRSSSLRLAGARGYIPMSLNIGAEYLTAHWESVLEGAASAGRAADRRMWRHAKEIYVAETNAEAREAVVNGPMGR